MGHRKACLVISVFVLCSVFGVWRLAFASSFVRVCVFTTKALRTLRFTKVRLCVIACMRVCV